MVADQFIWLVAAAIIVGLAKGGMSSAGALAVPLAALAMNPIVAAAILLPVFLVTDVVALWLYRKDFSQRDVGILAPSLILGIFLATFAVPFISEAFLLLITGVIGIWAVSRNYFKRSEPTQPSSSPILGVFWGTVAGVTTFFTHSGAPPIQAYLIPKNLGRLVFAGTMAVTLAIGNFAKIPGYATLGLFEGLDWSLVGMLVGAGIAATYFGRWLVLRMTDKVYMRVIEILLLCLSVLLLGKAAQLLMT